MTNVTNKQASSPDPEPFALPSQESPEAAWWRDSMTTLDDRMAWWRQGRFGMLMHWWLYSALGSEWEVVIPLSPVGTVDREGMRPRSLTLRPVR